jgi:hypothetical protein
MAETLSGRCHCGNIEVVFEVSVAPERLPMRTCACSFCSRHGARTVTDRRGRVRLTMHDPAQVIRYRFGLRTADFLVCGRCGIYVAAVMRSAGSAYATVNVNTLEAADRLTQRPLTVSYDNETEVQRRMRRAAAWTPAVEVVAS